MPEEIRIAGRIEEMHARVVEIERAYGKLQRVLQLLLDRRVVAHRGAALDAPRGRHRPRVSEEGFGKRSLPGARLPDEGKRPDVLDGIGHGDLLWGGSYSSPCVTGKAKRASRVR